MSEFLKTSLEYVLHKPISGSRPKGGVSIVGEIPSLGGENITMEGGLKLEVVKKISSEFFKSMPRGQLRNLDVLINKDGANTGKSTIYRKSPFLNAAVNEHLFILRGKEGKLDQEYLHHLLQFSLIKAILEIKITGSAQPGINSTFVKNFPVDLAPFPEQKKIASILTSVDEVIENTQKQIDKLQDLKKATMNELLTKGIGHTEFKDSELGRIPKSWKEVSLGKLIDKLIDFRGKTPKKLGLDWGGGKIKALSANNVKMGRVDFEQECYLASDELYEKWMTKGDSRKDDVLFTMEAPLGNVCLVPDNNRYILSQRVILFRVNKLILPSYIQHTLASQYFQNTLVKHSTGTTATGIKQKNLVKLKLLVPTSIEEQKKIASIITSIDKKIEYIQKKLSQTQYLKKSLMQDLLTGKVRVTVN